MIRMMISYCSENGMMINMVRGTVMIWVMISMIRGTMMIRIIGGKGN